jgi:hypothetical protein
MPSQTDVNELLQGPGRGLLSLEPNMIGDSITNRQGLIGCASCPDSNPHTESLRSLNPC